MPTSTTIPKQLQESRLYAKLSGYTNDGDAYHLRFTGAATLSVTAGTETITGTPNDVMVIAESPVSGTTTVKLNDTDTATFVAGDPIGSAKTKSLTKALDATEMAAGTGIAGDLFTVMEDPDVDSADTALPYVQSVSGTPAYGGESQTYDTHGMYRGRKKLVQSEPHQVSVTTLYQAGDQDLSQFRGHRFHILEERDDNRAGTITERGYFINCYDPNVAPSEQAGDNDSDESYTFQCTHIAKPVQPQA